MYLLHYLEDEDRNCALVGERLLVSAATCLLQNNMGNVFIHLYICSSFIGSFKPGLKCGITMFRFKAGRWTSSSLDLLMMNNSYDRFVP